MSNGIKCWGDNSNGQLGNGTTTSSLSPVNVTGLSSGVSSIAAGDNQTCALTTSGAVKCWGNNLNGQLGNGSNVQATTPTDVTGLSGGVIAIAAGDNHTCAALASGTVRCWGWGTSGQLGNNANTSSPVPVDVQGLPGGTTAVALSAGYRHSCAVLSNGSARCWGRNNEGQLGSGNNTTSRVAVTPVGLTNSVTAIAAGGSHTCVVQGSSTKCFGYNGAGQLGNGATANANSPVTVSGLTTATSLALGSGHSCARTSAGTVKCWGLNQDGELGIGDPDINNVTTPVDVPGLTGQTAVSGGIQTMCSRTSSTIRCWGVNTYGQLGTGNTTGQFSPAVVIGF